MKWLNVLINRVLKSGFIVWMTMATSILERNDSM